VVLGGVLDLSAAVLTGHVRATNVWGLRVDSTNLVHMPTFGLESRTHTSFHDTFNDNAQPIDLVPQHFHDAVKKVTVYDGSYGDTGWFGRTVQQPE
jgi:hypothetical protein